MKKLTLQQLKDMKADIIFAAGKTTDDSQGINMSNSGQPLRWVAVRGGIWDWAIYIDFAEKSIAQIRDMGNKVTDEKNIKKLVDCDNEAFKMYRY